MPEYVVRWEIEEDADSPHEAAEQARLRQLDPNAQVGHFEVMDTVTGNWRTVDLTPDE